MTRPRFIAAALLLACTTLVHGQPAAPAKPTAAQRDPPPKTQPEDEPKTQPQPQPQPAPEPALIIRDLVVLQTDRYDSTANNPKLVPTTLFSPIKHHGRAKRLGDAGAYQQSPMPLGLITFEGTIREPIKLQLTLDSKWDQFHAHWPVEALAGDQFIQWQQLREADDQQNAQPLSDPTGWLTALRDSEDRLWLRSRDASHGAADVRFKERFLLYDASFKFKPAIDLQLQNNAYRVSTRAPERAAPPLTVLVRHSDAGWTADALASPWPQPTAAIAQKTSTAAAHPDLAQALKPIEDLLEQRGYNDQETTLALGMIASAGVEDAKLALIYILPVGGIDEHVQLQIKPKPDKLIRTAIVVVTNADPDLGSQVNALIDDLGSDQWLQRDRAQRELQSLGQAAIRKIQPLKDSPDPEIAFRARQILDAYDLRMGGDK